MRRVFLVPHLTRVAVLAAIGYAAASWPLVVAQQSEQGDQAIRFLVMALTNAIFLVLMLLGGLVVPLDRLPEPLAAISSLLPAAALADTLRVGLGSAAGDPTSWLLVLAAWATGAVGAAAMLFRWD